MHVLTHHVQRAGQHAGSVGTSLTDILERTKQAILSRGRPVIRALGMSDKPWSAVFWIVIAVVLAVLFVITFVMSEGSMWT